MDPVKTVVRQTRQYDGVSIPWQVRAATKYTPAGAIADGISLLCPGVKSVAVTDSEITVVFDRRDPLVVYDPAPPPPPPEKPIKELALDYLQASIAGDVAKMAAINKVAFERYRTKFDSPAWSFFQLATGTGPIGQSSDPLGK